MKLTPESCVEEMVISKRAYNGLKNNNFQIVADILPQDIIAVLTSNALSMKAEPFICTVCGEGFFSESSQRQHVMFHHKGHSN